MRLHTLVPALTIAWALLAAGASRAAIELVTVTKATQKDCRLSFRVAVRPHPNGSGAKVVALTIPAKQVEALHVTPSTSYTFQVREGKDVPLNVPLALAKQRDGSLRTEITVSEAYGRKAWVVLHVWLSEAGSGTAFSIDLGSYLTGPAGRERERGR
jgi:hypothetical protein